MDERQFKQRRHSRALRTIRLVESLSPGRTPGIIGRQGLRSSTSIGASDHAARRGKSSADVLAKLAIVEEEAGETLQWMELLIESGLVRADRLGALMSETDDIIAVTVAPIKTLRNHR